VCVRVCECVRLCVCLRVCARACLCMCTLVRMLVSSHVRSLVVRPLVARACVRACVRALVRSCLPTLVRFVCSSPGPHAPASHQHRVECESQAPPHRALRPPRPLRSRARRPHGRQPTLPRESHGLGLQPLHPPPTRRDKSSTTNTS
jgi:hypothetical protein